MQPLAEVLQSGNKAQSPTRKSDTPEESKYVREWRKYICRNCIT